jgi:hypothetical protein
VRKPTIYEALKARLGREPLDIETREEIKRILTEGLIERAEAGKLPHQRRR